MSGFIKRNKTVNPAGGINPASSPNVGQYGWTNYDAGNVNQIIEYVNMAREAATSAKDSADYVAGKIDELEETLDYMEDFLANAGPIFTNIEAIYKDIILKHTEVKSMHTDVSASLVLVLQAQTDAHNSAQEAHGEAVKSEISAEASAKSAADSEVSNKGSKGWYDMSKDLYDALQAGQVYRGTWNPVTNAYPTKPTTNSAWDVSLPAGVSEHKFDNKDWHSGDRLLFSLATGAFEQLSVGGSVSSVNGKSGAVTLNAADVGAYPTTGGNVTGSINANASSKQITFKNANNYISMGGDDLYVSAINGATSRIVLQSFKNPLVSIATTPGSPAVTNYEIYHRGNKPTAAEVEAVGLTGAQTMSGQLNGIKFTASDSYGFVSRLRGFQGMFMGTGTDTPGRRTIIGGGGDVAGDALGTVVIRANGITDNSGEVTFSPTGLITAPALATQGSHLANATFVNNTVNPVKVTADAAKATADKAVPLAGAVMEGTLHGKSGMKSAMSFANKASIRYYDGGGTHFHNFAEGNALYWKTGGAGENACAYLTSAGIFNTEGAMYAKTGMITRSRNSSTWIGLEAPEDGAPYISTKTASDSGPNVSMRFGGTEISVESNKRLASNSMRVAHDGGLRFAVSSDFAGTSWGMGINPSTGVLGIHKYLNGGHAGEIFSINNANQITARTPRFEITGDTYMTGYSSINGGGNNGLEFHQPGNSATFVYKPMGRSALRIGQGNGAAGEVLNFLDIDAAQAGFNGKVTSRHQSSRGWSSAGDSVFYGGGSTVAVGALSALVAQWVTVPGMASYEHGYGFLSDSSGNIGNYGHAMWCQDSGSYLKSWMFRNNGGQQSPSGFRIEGDGRMAGDIYSGYEDHIHWTTASLAATSDERLKTILGETTKSAIDIVNQFQFKRFVWNEKAGKVYHERDTKVTEIGLIAQQVESVDPVLVKTITTGGENPSDTKTLDTAAMLALAMKAIQEQQVQINELKEKLNDYVLK